MISKMKRPEEGGARLAIVFNGSPLFTGGAGSGESEIRRWIIENDMLEAVVRPAPTSYSTTPASPPTSGCSPTARRPAVRARCSSSTPATASPRCARASAKKRKEISAEQIGDLTRLYGAFEEGPRSKTFPNESFGFLRVTLERPLRLRWEITDDTLAVVAAHKAVTRLAYGKREALVDALRSRTVSEYASEKLARAAVQKVLVSANGDKPAALVKALIECLAVRDSEAPIVTDRAGSPKPDPNLRDHENVPLPQVRVAFEPDPTARLETIEYSTAVDDYLTAEVHPYVPDAWPEPRQDQDRLRDSPNPLLLYLQTTSSVDPD